MVGEMVALCIYACGFVVERVGVLYVDSYDKKTVPDQRIQMLLAE